MSTITIARTVPTGPEGAWRAWTDPAELARWWWPHLADTAYDWEVRVGAAYRIESREAGFGISGEFTEVDPPRRMGFTWRWLPEEPGAGDEAVEVTFEPVAEGTVVTVRHTGAEVLAGSGAERGWNDAMDRLAQREAPRPGGGEGPQAPTDQVSGLS